MTKAEKPEATSILKGSKTADLIIKRRISTMQTPANFIPEQMSHPMSHPMMNPVAMSHPQSQMSHPQGMMMASHPGMMSHPTQMSHQMTHQATIHPDDLTQYNSSSCMSH